MRPLILSLIALAGCASTPVLEGPAPALAPPPPAVAPLTRAPVGKLFRDDVTRAVDQGFGMFLQKIKVEANVLDGKFAGWIVRALYPRDFWDGIDLQPGDVVTQVNDKPIERDNQAFEVFQSLKTAPRLSVRSAFVELRDRRARAGEPGGERKSSARRQLILRDRVDQCREALPREAGAAGDPVGVIAGSLLVVEVAQDVQVIGFAGPK